MSRVRKIGVLAVVLSLTSAAVLVSARLADAQSDPNAFNRLLRPLAERNASPATDGIHDPDGIGTTLLQNPTEAFENMPQSMSGNYVDWSMALTSKLISPRTSLDNPNAPPVVLDLNIVREVKGSMPSVLYPHKQHTEWLDCVNCHPAIFIPMKGANQISMASILLGEKCGVCHGTVAFPVSECRRCHSQAKVAEEQQ